MRIRYLAVAAGLSLVAAACGAEVGLGGDPAPGDPPAAGAVPSALVDADHPDLPEPLVPAEQIISGGPPPDGIPPIDDPAFVPIAAADAYLDPTEPVVALEIDGDARAYPVQVLIWHEIVNDTVAGVPVAVTYCPLCNSAVSYVREIDGVETTFGTSGRLYLSALVMYDRATESLWTHFDGRAVAGALTGTRLEPVPSPLLAWSDFKLAHPDGLVLDRTRTGASRDYGANPYRGYDDPDAVPFLFRGEVDERARLMQRVVGVTIGDESRAWTLDSIAGGAASVTYGELGGSEIAILWKAGQASALEAGAIEGGRDVGSVTVVRPVVDGRRLTLIAAGDRFVDEETGSRWDITGRAVAGELAGSTLERVGHLDTFWFAWSSYRPGTDIVEG